ncbi:hypothetical protein C8Q69DRAFT_73362 [Paecilomyces variotii]|uniref:Uncharacterized protein n=1 Tax=Byssochlamys spectabilis TaxID=264951 RepID=A0A443HM27_BYSSP|nr:hypothetical protein C8Q69DRAFT_73362 [Paecilomyces variotii]RWQ92861.1 hypothetical protein C8Q69DRAFT_73362 [Paecilomyces variotii]
MMEWLELALAILVCIFYPIFWLVRSLVSLLGILATPFLHIASNVLRVAFLPLRILSRFESIFIFFGVASLIGITAGLVLHLTSKLVVRVLHLSQEPSPPTPHVRKHPRSSKDHLDEFASAPGKSLPFIEDTQSSAYPETRGAPPSDAAAKLSGNYYPRWSKGTRGQSSRGLFSTTILEEDDDFSDADDFEQ